MAIAIEIRYTRHIPAGRNSWTIRTADVEIIIQVPDRGLTRAGVVKHIIWFAVAVEVGGATNSHPMGRVGPYALPMNVGPDKYQIAVCSVKERNNA